MTEVKDNIIIIQETHILWYKDPGRNQHSWLIISFPCACEFGFHFHLQGAFNSCYHQAFALCFQSFRSHTRTEIFWGWCWMSLRINRSPALLSGNQHLPFLLSQSLALLGAILCVPGTEWDEHQWACLVRTPHRRPESSPSLHCSLALSVKSRMLLSNGTFLEILQRQEGRKDHPSYIFQTCHKHTHPKIWDL